MLENTLSTKKKEKKVSQKQWGSGGRGRDRSETPEGLQDWLKWPIKGMIVQPTIEIIHAFCKTKTTKTTVTHFMAPTVKGVKLNFKKKSDQDSLNVSIYKSNQISAQELRVKKHQNPSLNERRKFTVVKTWFSLSFFYADVNIMLVYVRSLKGGLAFGLASHVIIRRFKGPILCRIHLT